jgi:hypothetical protein
VEQPVESIDPVMPFKGTKGQWNCLFSQTEFQTGLSACENCKAAEAAARNLETPFGPYYVNIGRCICAAAILFREII